MGWSSVLMLIFWAIFIVNAIIINLDWIITLLDIILWCFEYILMDVHEYFYCFHNKPTSWFHLQETINHLYTLNNSPKTLIWHPRDFLHNPRVTHYNLNLLKHTQWALFSFSPFIFFAARISSSYILGVVPIGS
jgi:hypothetical protein